MGWLSKLTDTIGITDTESGNRAATVAGQTVGTANQTLKNDTQGVTDTLSSAMQGRDLTTNLNNFSTQANKAQDLTWDASNAGDAANVRSYLNPKMDEITQQVMQNVQGGAGAALQSSATNRTASNAIANKVGEMWDSAYNQALSDSQNNQQVAQNGLNVASTNLNAQNQPTLDWMSMQNDLAKTKYNGALGTSQAAVSAAAQKNTIL